MEEWQTLTQADIDRWRDAALNGDPEGALRIGEYLLQRANSRDRRQDDRQIAATWLAHAGRVGGAPLMWRIAAITVEHLHVPGAASGWQRAAIIAEWQDSDIDVDQNTFYLDDFEDAGWVIQDFAVRVSGEPDDAVRDALTTAASRMYCTGDDGVEYEDGETAVDSADYNPNFVSEPEAHADGGWEIWMDCKGGSFPLMAATMIRILADELRKAGVRSARIGPPQQPESAPIQR
jgi:hypothetical protein